MTTRRLLRAAPPTTPVPETATACVPIAEVTPGAAATVRGIVRSLRARPWANGAELELVLADRTGRVQVRFERDRPAVRVGDRVEVRGQLLDITSAQPVLVDPATTVVVTEASSNGSPSRL